MPSETSDRRLSKPAQVGAPPPEPEHLRCPRCDSTNTKFCYYNNYNFSQPRHFCKACRRYWTNGGTLRDIPVGGGTRKSAKRSRSTPSSASIFAASNQDYRHMSAATTPFFLPLSGGNQNGMSVPFVSNGKPCYNMPNSFTSLLGTQGPGLLSLGGFGLGIGHHGLEDMSFGLGRNVWACPPVGDCGVSDNGVSNTWQLQSNESGFAFDDESDGMEYDESNGDEDDEISEDEEDSEEEMENAVNEEQNVAEVEELEKEYMELRDQEQDLFRNIRRQNDDLLKGQAVKNQKALWDKTLELRISLQKAFSSSNKLPQDPARSLFCDFSSETSEAYSDLITSSKKTLDSMLELQEALLEKNPTITQGSNGNFINNTKRSEASADVSDEEDQEWLKISEMQSRIVSFRNKAVDKWQRKAQVTTGAAAIKGKLQAFNQSISDQVAAYMRDPSRMVNGMQQTRKAITIFGPDPETSNNTKEEVATGDPELLDDSEFYQQLLKEFFESVDPTSSEAAFYAIKRMQTKKRKVVDQRASKSRKIRYTVHEKIVNFMAPQPMNLPPMAPKLFENLFGLKTQKAS